MVVLVLRVAAAVVASSSSVVVIDISSHWIIVERFTMPRLFDIAHFQRSKRDSPGDVHSVQYLPRHRRISRHLFDLAVAIQKLLFSAKWCAMHFLSALH